MNRITIAVAGIVCASLACWAGIESGEAHEAPRPDRKIVNAKKTIEFQFHYRANSRTARFTTRKLKVVVKTTNGPVPEIPSGLPAAAAEFDEWKVVVQPGVNNLRVSVSDRKNGKILLSQLFQLGPGIRNQFHGGHGFTGLNYLYHPGSESELQFWGAVK